MATPTTAHGGRNRTKLIVGLLVAGLTVLVGLVVFSLVSLIAVVFFSASQSLCSSDGSTAAGGDSSVPLPAENPSARLQVSVASWNTYYKNSVDNIVRGFRAIEAAGGAVAA